ncbi:MAG: 4Fe-4S dicluster domain-containing protein [bacterium]|jgi:carbon-monoxide dehydrogenase iron sulfur subunit
MKRMKIEPVKCVGCKICEITCSFHHFGVFSHEISNCVIKGFEETADFTPLICVQCDERSCVHSCPVEALSINPDTGAVLCDHDQCIKCGLCIEACEYDGIRFIKLEGEDRIAVCDLCGGDPKCVKRCYLKAISYEDDGSARENEDN